MSVEVLLVNPNRMKPAVAPLALEYLATALETAGISCAVADLCFAQEPATALGDQLDEHDPGLVAVSWRNSDDCYCATRHSFIPYYQELIDSISRQTDALIVLGGAGFSTAPEALLDETGADHGIVGDGEQTLVELSQALEELREPLGIPGLLCWGDDEWLGYGPRWEPFGQEALPRVHLDNARYYREGGQAGLETKRGCPMKCTYCADPHSKGPHARLRPPAAVVQEARNLLGQGIEAIHLCDSEFNCPVDHAKEVCRAFIDAGLGDRLRWWGYLSPAPVDDELVELMVRSGCAGVDFGADSGNAAMLKRLGRPFTPEDLTRTAQLCHKHDLPFMYDLLLGGPGETRESLRETIELMKTLDPSCVGVAFGMRLYAGTRAADLAWEQGLRPENPNLQGRTEDNEEFAWPVFYVEHGLGDDAVGYLRQLIGGDQRFFFGWPDEAQADYNYDDNQALVDAIAGGARGAYWDILRRL